MKVKAIHLLAFARAIKAKQKLIKARFVWNDWSLQVNNSKPRFVFNEEQFCNQKVISVCVTDETNQQDLSSFQLCFINRDDNDLNRINRNATEI